MGNGPVDRPLPGGKWRSARHGTKAGLRAQKTVALPHEPAGRAALLSFHEEPEHPATGADGVPEAACGEADEFARSTR